MSKPSEHKTVQARILAYAKDIGWTFVSPEEAERRRGLNHKERSGHKEDLDSKSLSSLCSLRLFFEDILHAKVREFNPRYAEAEGALLGKFRHLHTDIYGNREFVEHLRNRGKFFDHEEKRERDLILIDYDDPAQNVYEVTEEWAFHNGHYGTREDVVFLINGIPVLVIECKNANKDEAIALGVDQIRRYHRETPELFVSQQLFTATDAIGFSYGVSWNTVRRNVFNWKATEHGFSNPCSSSDTDRNVRAPFYSPQAKTDKHRRNLPHWRQGEVWCFVTWRLRDSLPAGKLREWQDEKEIWLGQHPVPWDESTEEEYHQRISRQIDEWLDQGSGACVLRDPGNAKIVADALRHFNGERCELASFVVMPNHVHVLFRPRKGHLIEEIMKSWKGFTAREINKRMGTKGKLWQEEYWDRLVRSERHFLKYADYIRNNPVKAKLSNGFMLWEEENGLSSPLVEGKNGLENPWSVIGKLEAKVKSFCAIPQVLAFLKDYIVFAEKDEELNKYILRQHQTGAVEATVSRALDPKRTRGLIWNTQGSGKTFTMIKAAEMLFRAPEADKPTVLLMIDRNELEDQMLKNLAALGLSNLKHASSIARLNQLLRDDYRGIIVTMIHKFRDMPANLNLRKNIYVLIDEAHRTTGGDLGNFLMAALPNASFIGFTGTPVDKTVYGKGTFKTFGCEDDQGYLHKYSIADSIEDGTTLPLYYQLAPNEMLVPHETLDKEFLSLAEAEGVADIEELNKILERSVNLKNFLKGKERIQKVAKFVAEHYRENVEPLGYKAFLVGVDREACAHYKHALDQFLPPEYSEVVYTGSNNDSALLKEFHLDPKKERQIRKSFGKLDQMPKILIVTEKLLTGFDAPVLYAMYLDKPMRDHTLLQAIARVNRPYENEAQEMVKPHGFVLDFVGIFDKLEKALAFDSDEINAIVKDLKLLKVLFKNKMESKAPAYLGLIERDFNDKDVDTLIEHFRDPERRKEFFKEYKEIEMLYEIISPDAFLRPFIEDYTTLAAIYEVVRNAYTRRVYVDRDFQKKTNALVQKHIGASLAEPATEYVVIDRSTIETIKLKDEGKATKVINLIKAIQKEAEEKSDDPFLLAMEDRARAVQEAFEARQDSTEQALENLLSAIAKNEARKKEQAAKGLDSFTYFMMSKFTEEGIPNPEKVAGKVREAFEKHPNWKSSEAELREARKQVTFAIFSEEDDLNKVTATVDALFTLLQRSHKP
ncbi:MAG: HsdR family type I site-specific deoxyribonuclease [Verrucomicrobia bacterium]|nr:MAG: HsdR family type I site-specific deoxyribonuclease [Verrucomicrobiota bacterium]